MESWEGPIDTGDVPSDGSDFDVIVVGGGPCGAAAAAYNAMNGCKVLLLEKEVWPRDKTCGDAVGGKSLTHVEELGVKAMIEATPYFRVDSIVFGSANGNTVRVMLPKEEFEKKMAGYALPRVQFDYMMFKRSTELVLGAGGAVIQGFGVTEVGVEDGRVTGVTGRFGGRNSTEPEISFRAPLTIGAGGYNCPVAKTVTEVIHGEPMRDDDHYCGAYREYWEGVGGFEGSEGPIEIHFIDEVIPGYFWIFPVREGLVNVGIGMVISEQRKQKGIKKSLKQLQKWVIEEHPKFKVRFEGARVVPGSQKGWQLPFGSPRKNPPSFQPRRSATAGAMCVGDAASLVDPFTGEGIGNGLVSSKLASEHFDKDAHSRGFPEEAAIAYMEEIWGTLGKELSNSYRLQKWVKRKWLMNWFFGKASRKEELADMLTGMIADKEASKALWSPWFLAKTLLLP
ncbi:MAG: NAD(P)/FAD-dependent oxidoreductase [Candidatus Thalassarchaeaceae archaeon]|jgi:geranylgeranyl reductase family protein|nr:NAD(P)/FAD-dependent oxidoreductase [Candidatus Thalassarchaeaceae archaeon]MDP7257516.1 NAD(P)/FAD-dependent oxidoreductase [Candidatus Thalassarchaeaceae archaeon]MDP7649011.1 NAD(P)/FAD-dependent oxidoreductase [Candidatus Thalassarchaeaceae archaeon]